jgi:hypothetical protein
MPDRFRASEEVIAQRLARRGEVRPKTKVFSMGTPIYLYSATVPNDGCVARYLFPCDGVLSLSYIQAGGIEKDKTAPFRLELVTGPEGQSYDASIKKGLQELSLSFPVFAGTKLSVYTSMFSLIDVEISALFIPAVTSNQRVALIEEKSNAGVRDANKEDASPGTKELQQESSEQPGPSVKSELQAVSGSGEEPAIVSARNASSSKPIRKPRSSKT